MTSFRKPTFASDFLQLCIIQQTKNVRKWAKKKLKIFENFVLDLQSTGDILFNTGLGSAINLKGSNVLFKKRKFV